MNRRERRKQEMDMLKDKSAKDIIDDAKSRIESTKKHPMWKRILAGSLLPLVYVLWTIDRFLHLALPHATHDSFKMYLLGKASLQLTFIRMFLAGCIIGLLYLIF